MKIEPASPEDRRPESAGAPARRQQWLLDLERALLEKWPHPGEDLGDGRAGRRSSTCAAAEGGKPEVEAVSGRAQPSSQAPQQDGPAARYGFVQRRAETDPSGRAAHVPGVRDPLSAPGLPALQREDRSGEQAFFTPLDEESQACLRPAVGEPAPGGAVISDEVQPREPAVMSVVPSSARLAGRTAAPGPAEGDRSTRGAAAAPYARRLLQLAGSDALRVNVRDAALSQVQQAAVASALFVQLQSLGRAVSQIYVNGVLFSPARATTDASAQPGAPSLPNNPSSEE